MSTTGWGTPTAHPVQAAASAIRAALKDVSDVQPTFMSPDQLATALSEVTAVRSQLAELEYRLLAAGEPLADRDGARDIGSWVSHRLRTDSRAARADQRLAIALDRRWARLAAGMRDGDVNPDQARVIATALEALPADLDPGLVASAEERLVDYASEFGPEELRRLGRRILEVIAPEIAETELAKALEREEQRARETASVRQKRLGDGRTRTTITGPDAEADRLKTYLEAFTSPRTGSEDTSTGTGTEDTGSDGLGGLRTVGEEDQIPYHRRLGHAFSALLEHLDPTRLPAHGGDATTIMVTIGFEDLKRDLATAGIIGSTLNGTRAEISAAEARRLACTATLVPVVLDGESQPLDLGRAKRLFTRAQRKALRLRDQHCRAEGCTHPATWCEAHHLKRWVEGGNTNLADGVLLCPFHHHRVHDPRFTHQQLPNGDLRIHRLQ